MPMYDWADTNSQKRVAIIRHSDLWEEIPTREEAAALTDQEYADASWERLIAAPKMVKGRSWGPGKGYW